MLFKLCWKIIDEHSEEALRSDGFVKYLNSVLSSPVGFPVNEWLCTFARRRFGNLDNVDSSYSYFS